MASRIVFEPVMCGCGCGQAFTPNRSFQVFKDADHRKVYYKKVYGVRAQEAFKERVSAQS